MVIVKGQHRTPKHRCWPVYIASSHDRTVFGLRPVVAGPVAQRQRPTGPFCWLQRLTFLIKIKLLKIGAPIKSEPVLPLESPAPISTPSPDETPEVGVLISQIKYGFQWARKNL